MGISEKRKLVEEEVIKNKGEWPLCLWSYIFSPIGTTITHTDFEHVLEDFKRLFMHRKNDRGHTCSTIKAEDGPVAIFGSPKAELEK